MADFYKSFGLALPNLPPQSWEYASPLNPNTPAPWGYRVTGAPKGMGFLGFIPSSTGETMTEYSVNAGEGEMPSLVPTLTNKEIEYLRKLPSAAKIPDSIYRKIIEHARQRRASGMSPFATPFDVPQFRVLGRR